MESSPAFFQQPQASHHPQGHIQGPYPPSQNGNAPITSPNQQQIHQAPSQTSPLMSPPNPYVHSQAAPTHPQMYSGNYMQYPPLNASQATAMAVAAASGPHYYPPVNNSLPIGQDKSRGSPSTLPQQIGGRRVSHGVPSPVVQQPQGPLVNGPRGPTGTMGPPPAQLPPPQTDSGEAQDTPLYVNAKQFHRILKRRSARQKLEEQLRLTSKARKPYLHESRHNHAMRRPRGPGGRFLTSEEVAAMEKNSKEGGGDGLALEDVPKPAETGSKRKAAGGSAAAKKAKSAKLAVKEPEEGVEDAEDDD